MKPPRHRFRALFRTLGLGVTVVLTLACVVEVGVVVADAQPLLPEVVFGETVPNGNQSRVLDLNGDGTLDVLLLEGEVALPSIGTNRLLAYPGVGDGTFLDPLASDLLVVPELILAHQFSVTDYNQDGLPDVIVSIPEWALPGVYFQVMTNLGGYQFQQGPVLFEPDLLPFDQSTADFNGDGIGDLVVTGLTDLGTQTSEVYLYLGDAAGGLTRVTELPVGSWHSLATGDVDQDGDLDVVVSGGVGITVLLGDGLGGMTVGTPPGVVPSICRESLLVDFDQNGTLDLLGISDTPRTLFLAPGNGSGAFATPTAIPLGENGFDILRWLAASDFDGDGNLDVVVSMADYVDASPFFTGRLFLFRGNGAGSWLGFNPNTQTVEPDFELTTTRPELGDIGDIDNDGDDDIVFPCILAGATSRICTIFNNSSVTPTNFIRGDVDGNLALALPDVIALLQALFSGGVLGCADAADVNDDGALTLPDAIALLNALFLGGALPPPPSSCGVDPSIDALGCVVACP